MVIGYILISIPHTQSKKSEISHIYIHTQSMRDSRQNGNEFEQYPRKLVYLSSLGDM